MKELFILRHGKSSWGDNDKADIDRPLKAKGIRDVRDLASSLAGQVEPPQLILSSPADRAIHTAVIFADTIKIPMQRIRIDERLYAANELTVERVLSELDPSFGRVMVVGHNPTLTYLVNRYIDEPILELPTSGMVIITFEADQWNELEPERVVRFRVEIRKG